MMKNSWIVLGLLPFLLGNKGSLSRRKKKKVRKRPNIEFTSEVKNHPQYQEIQELYEYGEISQQEYEEFMDVLKADTFGSQTDPTTVIISNPGEPMRRIKGSDVVASEKQSSQYSLEQKQQAVLNFWLGVAAKTYNPGLTQMLEIMGEPLRPFRLIGFHPWIDSDLKYLQAPNHGYVLLLAQGNIYAPAEYIEEIKNPPNAIGINPLANTDFLVPIPMTPKEWADLFFLQAEELIKVGTAFQPRGVQFGIRDPNKLLSIIASTGMPSLVDKYLKSIAALQQNPRLFDGDGNGS